MNGCNSGAEGSLECVRHFTLLALIFSFGFFTLDFTVIDGLAIVIPIGKTFDIGQLFSCELETGLLVSGDGTRAS